MGSPGAGSSGGGHECSFKILLIGDSGVGKSSLLVSFVAAAHLDDDIAPTIGTPLATTSAPAAPPPPRPATLAYADHDHDGAPGHLQQDTIAASQWPCSATVSAYARTSGTIIESRGGGKLSLAVEAPTTGASRVDFKIKFLTVGGKKLKLTIWDTAGQERFRTITSSYYRGAQGIILVYDVTKRESFTNLADVWTTEIEANSTNKDCIKMLVGNKVDKDGERMVTREEGLAFAQESGCLFLESSAKTRENVEKCFEELALKILEVPSLLEEGSSSVVKRNILKQKQESNTKHGGGCCQ
ncbi:hypothetical protein ACP4OV_027759 [Aristida adscensionis]